MRGSELVTSKRMVLDLAAQFPRVALKRHNLMRKMTTAPALLKGYLALGELFETTGCLTVPKRPRQRKRSWLKELSDLLGL